MTLHSGACVIEDERKTGDEADYSPIGVACQQCATFVPCAFRVFEDGRLEALADLDAMDGCEEPILTNEEWERRVRAQVAALGLAARPS
jgi:hypothetical protein